MNMVIDSAVAKQGHITRPIETTTLVRILFWFFCFVSWGDAMTTLYVIQEVGVAKEGNVWMREAMIRLGVWQVCALRLLIGVVAVWHLSRSILRLKIAWCQRLKRWLWRVIVWMVRVAIWPLRGLARMCHSMARFIPTCRLGQSRLAQWLPWPIRRRFWLLVWLWQRRLQCLARLTRWLWEHPMRWLGHRSAAMEFAFALVVTSLVVGNNLRAVATLRHMS